jgi:hypothetical protein
VRQVRDYKTASGGDPHSLVLPDGRLDFPRMLEEFTEFWIENGEILASNKSYSEAAAQLRFQLKTGTLVIFDRRPDAQPIYERTTITSTESPAGRTITLLRA